MVGTKHPSEPSHNLQNNSSQNKEFFFCKPIKVRDIKTSLSSMSCNACMSLSHHESCKRVDDIIITPMFLWHRKLGFKQKSAYDAE
jgi:hypothetical protein